ncbi:MAG: hypothetical protein ACRDPR_17520, partial [Nocardioidaceae bacterium]
MHDRERAGVPTDLPSPVLAISVADEGIWLGGEGGVAIVSSGQERRGLWPPPFDGPVTAVHPTNTGLVAGGTAGIAVRS